MATIDLSAALRLLNAVREAMSVLGVDHSTEAALRLHADRCEAAVSSTPPHSEDVVSEVRSLRYLLVESADGPIAAVLADSAARILGDDVGKLFS